jgi:hypothetical protein
MMQPRGELLLWRVDLLAEVIHTATRAPSYKVAPSMPEQAKFTVCFRNTTSLYKYTAANPIYMHA